MKRRVIKLVDALEELLPEEHPRAVLLNRRPTNCGRERRFLGRRGPVIALSSHRD